SFNNFNLFDFNYNSIKTKMSITDRVVEKLTDSKETFTWFLKYNSIGNLLYVPFWKIMNRERRTEFPYYFPDEAKIVEGGVDHMQESIDNFIHCHEMEKNRDGDFEKTLAERLRWVLKNFHLYSNDTMSNLYFTQKLPACDYQR